ncbi:MAG: ectoine/hydroxyectoine ABC transporter permease subunit EhuC [Actinomycetia bacterium]|nr:ectoine/hydroxyectoine ABC transporter permease subunit EhuC [Actinomycetes bacterium]
MSDLIDGFNWYIDFITAGDHPRLLLDGLQMTVLITVLGLVVTVVVAFVAGLARLSRYWIVRAPAYVFVEFFRGTSLPVQLFWVYYVLPQLGLRIEAVAAGVLVIGLNEGSYAAEIVRGTIASRPKGQTEASIALGLSPGQRMRRILIPQSIPAMLPPFGNVFVDLLKATSLVSLIGVIELSFNAGVIRNYDGEGPVVYATVLVMYFVLALILAGMFRLLERRFAPGQPAILGPDPLPAGGAASGGIGAGGIGGGGI